MFMRILNVKTGLAFILISALLLMLLHYKHQAQHQTTRAQNAEKQLTEHRQHLTHLQQHQREIAALDKQHTKELRDAKAIITQLERDVAHGRKRLRLRATCSPVSDTASPTGLDDAPTPRLENTAKRDYFTLLRRLTLMQKQVEGLQGYVKRVTENEK